MSPKSVKKTNIKALQLPHRLRCMVRKHYIIKVKRTNHCKNQHGFLHDLYRQLCLLLPEVITIKFQIIRTNRERGTETGTNPQLARNKLQLKKKTLTSSSMQVPTPSGNISSTTVVGFIVTCRISCLSVNLKLFVNCD